VQSASQMACATSSVSCSVRRPHKVSGTSRDAARLRASPAVCKPRMIRWTISLQRPSVSGIRGGAKVSSSSTRSSPGSGYDRSEVSNPSSPAIGALKTSKIRPAWRDFGSDSQDRVSKLRMGLTSQRFTVIQQLAHPYKTQHDQIISKHFLPLFPFRKIGIASDPVKFTDIFFLNFERPMNIPYAMNSTGAIPLFDQI
jgi:hypothetical protein